MRFYDEKARKVILATPGVKAKRFTLAMLAWHGLITLGIVGGSP